MKKSPKKHCSRLCWALAALGLYTFVTLAVTYPIPLYMNTRIVGEEYRDAYVYTWALWWAKEAILNSDKELGYLSLMNHPYGVEHPFVLSMTGMYLLALPFSLLVSPAITYNLQVLSALVLSGFTMYWLCTELTGDPRAGLVGGLIFSIFPNKMGHVLGGHLPQISMQWFPLYVLFLRRAIRTPGWRTALPAIFILAIASLIHVMHLAYFLLPLTAIVLCLERLELRKALFDRRRIAWVVGIFLICFLVVAPFLLPTVFLSLDQETYLLEPGTVEHATDLLAFFTPSPYHPLLRLVGWWSSFSKAIFPNVRSLREGLAYPGLIATTLAVWGAIRQKREGKIWGILAISTAVLSLGPLLKMGGKLEVLQVDEHQSYIVLPYALLKTLPMFGIGRTPGRLNGTTMFAVSILAAYGMSHLLSWTARRPRWAYFFIGIVVLGTLFEYVIIWPFPTGTAEIPPSIQRIRAEPGDGALLHVPMTRRQVNDRAPYYQTFVPRPIVDGLTHRIVPEEIPWSEAILGLAEPDPAPGDIVPRPDQTQRVAWLRHFNVDYVVFHYLTYEKLSPDADIFYRDFIQTLLGPPKYEDELVAVFPVPEDASSPDTPFLYALSQQGWHPPEHDGSRWRRWMDERGSLYLYSTLSTTGSLQFTVDSHMTFPVLEIYQGDKHIDSFIVGDRVIYTTQPVRLNQGMNTFHFRAADGCIETLDDPRCWADALLSPPTREEQPLCESEAVRFTCRTFVFDQIRFVPLEDQLAGMSVEVNLGDQVSLRGWNISSPTLRPGDTLTVTLYWQASVPVDERYVFFVHLLSPDGSLSAQDDTPLVDRLLPFWPVDAVYGHSVVLRLPETLIPGEYRLLTGVYLWPSLERLPVLADVPGAEVRAVEINRIQVVR